MTKKAPKVVEIDENQQFWAEIRKIDSEQQIIEGYATTFSEDSQGETISREAVEGAIDDFMKFGNLREMHEPKAAGSVTKATIDDDGMYIQAKVVDPLAWTKVKEGVYKGFSIGGRALARVGKTITKMRMTEISLADRPVNQEALISLWKADVELNPVMDGIQCRPLDTNDPELTKNFGTYAISRLSDIIGSLISFRDAYSTDLRLEGESSDAPDQITAVIARLGRILRGIVRDETTPEELAESQPGEGIFMAELTKEEVAVVAGDVIRKVMEERDAKIASDELIAKAEQAQKAQNDRIDQLIKKNEELEAKLVELSKTPAEPKAAAGPVGTAVAKAVDTGGAPEEDESKLSPLALIRKAHQHGAALTPSGPIGMFTATDKRETPPAA